jgi:hypothetical protein
VKRKFEHSGEEERPSEVTVRRRPLLAKEKASEQTSLTDLLNLDFYSPKL